MQVLLKTSTVSFSYIIASLLVGCMVLSQCYDHLSFLVSPKHSSCADGCNCLDNSSKTFPEKKYFGTPADLVGINL